MLCVCFYLRRQTQREKGRRRECTCLAQLSSASNTAQIPRVLLHHVLTKKRTKRNFNKTGPRERPTWEKWCWFWGIFFFIKMNLCVLGWEKQIEHFTVTKSNLVTSHLATFFEPIAFAPEIKTPLQLRADYESNNPVNKRMSPQQFEESLGVFQLLSFFFTI